MADLSRSLRVIESPSSQYSSRSLSPLSPLKGHAADSAVGPTGRTVLVVDDDPLLRKLVDSRLADDGFEVVQARDGAEALEYLEAAVEKPDLILLDASMPDMDGFEVLRKLASDPKGSTIPVIMLTARRSRADVVAGLSHGARDYLIKPIKADELMSRVNRVFGSLA